MHRIKFAKIVETVAVAACLAVAAWVFVFVNRPAAQTGGEIAVGECVRGLPVTLSYAPPQSVPLGTEFVWSVDGEVIQRGKVTAEQPSAQFVPQSAGEHVARIAVGKFRQTARFVAEPPVLTVKVPDVCIVYGEDLPQITLAASGFLPGEGEDFCAQANCVAQTDGKLKVGSYTLSVESPAYRDYKTEIVCGTLTVLPRQLTVEGLKIKCRPYDGTTKAEVDKLGKLVGVVLGDSVAIGKVELRFDGALPGKHGVVVKELSLVGEDKNNYTVLCPDFDGEIAE